MIWSVIGDAISRLALSLLHTFIDDTFGAGSPSHVGNIRAAVQAATRIVLGDSAVAVDKSFIGPSLEILGFLISMPHAAIFHVALDKTFYSFFRVELSLPLPIDVRQCLASLASFS
jgi:hypothetical protein